MRKASTCSRRMRGHGGRHALDGEVVAEKKDRRAVCRDRRRAGAAGRQRQAPGGQQRGDFAGAGAILRGRYGVGSALATMTSG